MGSGFVHALTRDWQVGFIFQARSGSPLTPGVSNDNALTGEPNQRPVIVPGVDPYLAEPVWIPNAEWLQHPVAVDRHGGICEPASGGRGNAARGYLYGPGFWNADLAFSRNLTVGGAGRRVELRVEAFNLFNHVNWGNPNVTVGNTNAGMITGTSGDPRIMQFAVKYQF